MIKKTFLTLLLLSVLQSFSQEKNSNYLQLDFFAGNILPQSGAEHLIEGHPKGFLLSWNKRTFGEELWQQHFNYPDVGFTIGYKDFKSKGLGKLYAAYAHYNFYFFNREAKNKLMLTFGLGIAYNTNPYHRLTNNKNVSLGSHLNSSSYLKLFYQRENVFKNIGVQAGFTFIHASNASIKTPNKGINTYAINLGVNYNLDSKEQVFTTTIDKKNYREPIHYNANLFLGINESDHIGSGTYPSAVISFFADKRLNKKSAIQFGTEVHLHTYLKDHIKFQYVFNGDVSRTSFPDWKRFGLFVGHELFINKTSIVTQLGYYLYSPEILNETIYERIAVKRYFNKSFYVSIGVKVHLVNAEGVELGIGYRF